MSELKKLTDKITKNTDMYSKENIEKSIFLESKKKSTKTPILYFLESELENIKTGFSKGTLEDLKATPLFEKRSLLEYLPSQRHPIPYCVVRCKKEEKYFLIFRENGSGETRLIGKKGLLGGHIDEADKVFLTSNTPDKVNGNGFVNTKVDVIKTIENGLYRELEEEANLTKDIIEDISLIGFIKITEDGCVENDHLGLIYLIDVPNTNLTAVEEGVLSGDWFTKEEILDMKPSLERWTKLAFDNIL